MERPLPIEARERPTREQIAALPVYPALPPSQIHLLDSAARCAFAQRLLSEAGHVGFDTESKPVFAAGAPQTGPDIVQFATREHAFIVPTAAPGVADFLRAVIESDAIVKVGFGLASDRPQLQRRLGLRLGLSIDLSHLLRQRLGFKQAVGLKVAVALVLHQQLPKSRKVTTSNWASPQLSPRQLQYAANDAHASLQIYHALAG
ncbi:3'-5' exonuclease domain-containing protein 2 [Ideonella sp. B7]|uniref:3'-5' exonuclease n=1 Tax=Ideonella benzenivorans TaxID=2831643 RepID=UPI001CEC02D1|nr:3'-5' exonuclease [Ideonella benzenivorans]MCA6216006.1 3'-5' exonuclease domain-containing protein 2 [Ideonella benzenivorans]